MEEIGRQGPAFWSSCPKQKAEIFLGLRDHLLLHSPGHSSCFSVTSLGSKLARTVAELDFQKSSFKFVFFQVWEVLRVVVLRSYLGSNQGLFLTL